MPNSLWWQNKITHNDHTIQNCNTKCHFCNLMCVSVYDDRGKSPTVTMQSTEGSRLPKACETLTRGGRVTSSMWNLLLSLPAVLSVLLHLGSASLQSLSSLFLWTVLFQWGSALLQSLCWEQWVHLQRLCGISWLLKCHQFDESNRKEKWLCSSAKTKWLKFFFFYSFF